MLKLTVCLALLMAAAATLALDENAMKSIVNRQIYRDDVKSMKGAQVSYKNRYDVTDYSSDKQPANKEGPAPLKQSHAPSKQSHAPKTVKPRPVESQYPKQVVTLQPAPSTFAEPYTGVQTSFDCLKLKNVDYEYLYPDYETGCQVFHLCHPDGRQSSFQCPAGTIFDAKLQTCEWATKATCKY